ncbi:acyltransferase [Halobellus salinisoli]|uniref:acyltransferase n=1 Tax=Halobellus salinisoli TaxID=3108500 RepID=UPI00300A6A97
MSTETTGEADTTDLPRVIENCRFGDGTEVAPFAVLSDCRFGRDCRVWRFVNCYGATFGDEVMIGSFVEVQSDVVVGDRTRIQSHAFVPSLTELGDDVFFSHGAAIVNDVYPPSGDSGKWEETAVGDGAVIGTNATLLPVEVGENALVGAGAVVTEDVPPNAIVAGNPAEVVGYRE